MSNQSIALMGWVTIARKQIYQVSGLIALGYNVVVFTNDLFGDSAAWLNYCGSQVKMHKLKSSFFSRLLQIIMFLVKDRTCKLAIIAPCGQFSMFYMLICWLFQVKTVCIEWGDIGRIESLDPITQLNMKICYKHADLVWYKEVYMLNILEKYNPKKTYFLPNSVDTTNSYIPDFAERDLNFIWVNRFVTRRYPDWFVQAVNELSIEFDVQAEIMGILDKDKCHHSTLELQRKVQCALSNSKNIKAKNFGDPYTLYKKGRFFVLAADMVFGNNSLLESMSYGVVPIVTDSPGIEKIVVDGVNGIVTEKSYGGLLQGMYRAIQIDQDEWIVMSQNAVKKVTCEFSLNSWNYSMNNMISSILQN